MPHILSALYNFLRLGPIGLGVGAAIVLGIGYFLQVSQNDRVAAKAAALAAGPPAAVDVAKFDRESDATDLREVVLRGQAVFDYAYRLTLEKDTSDLEAFMVPIVSETATSERDIVAIALFYESGFRHDRLTPEFLTNGLMGFGDIGPIMEYNGKLSSLGSWEEITQDAFAEKGLTFSDDIIVVWPFIDGREVAFAPPEADDTTMFGFFSKIAGAIGLLALAKLVFRKEPEAKIAAPDVNLPPLSPEVTTAPQRSAAPLWKQRSGLVDESYNDAPAAQFDEPGIDVFAPKTASVIKPRAKFGVRKVLIGLVGGLFFLGLASTVSDLIGKSSTATVVKTQSTAEVIAESAAAAIVPDADPNRHWTDIDVAPIAEWFVAKFFLAVSGDFDAQILLLGMLLGVFVALFALRWYFIVRRTLRPKTTARFDSMGIN
ncbi:hypothetical protein [Octadecabacter ascidiaceicola]|uniref:Uncharacterized protein n=1 Tax=Octadecabacter ascidiaceicola TaxID=1655543 RepID=A0A238KL28_9RHOB|nr:hypothetical protein [Octadecabacter ascidiaceicola]SMX43515.1 hypothetical protein OCA8868_02978 [Octadecabacter ascidiaceicola]